MELPPLLVRSSDESKIFFLHKWTNAKCHLVQISQLIDCVYIGHALHYYIVLAAFWVCRLSSDIARLRVMRHGSITTIASIFKKKKPEQSLQTLLNNSHVLHQSSAGRQDPMKGTATSLLQLH